MRCNRRAIDIKPDDVAQFGDNIWVVDQGGEPFAGGFESRNCSAHAQICGRGKLLKFSTKLIMLDFFN
jgi:hypothetical protein